MFEVVKIGSEERKAGLPQWPQTRDRRFERTKYARMSRQKFSVRRRRCQVETPESSIDNFVIGCGRMAQRHAQRQFFWRKSWQVGRNLAVSSSRRHKRGLLVRPAKLDTTDSCSKREQEALGRHHARGITMAMRVPT